MRGRRPFLTSLPVAAARAAAAAAAVVFTSVAIPLADRTHAAHAAADDAAPPAPWRLRSLEDEKTRSGFPAEVDVADFVGAASPADLPDILGDAFDPATVDEIAVGGNARAVAWATLISEAGLPGTARDIVLFREGVAERVRVSDAAGDNDQPSLDFDPWGLRMVWRGSAGARGTTAGNVYFRSTRRKAPTTGEDGTQTGATEEVETVQVTELTGTQSAWAPTLTARMRDRDAGSGVKVRERDARIAFASNGDLDEGRNPSNLPQLFVWLEQDERFVQITRIEAAGFEVDRPSISASGARIAFESTADLTPDAVDPRSSARIGNPAGVRQIFVWDLGRGIRQVTWSDEDCLSPRISRNGRQILFSSRGEVIPGGNPEGNSEIFAWADVRDPARRVRQLTRTMNGDSVLPRPTASPRIYAFWSTCSPPTGSGTLGSGERQYAPIAYLHVRGRDVRMAGPTNAEHLLRLADSPDPGSPENPILAGPPCPGTDATKVQFATNDPSLNLPGADDDLDGDDGAGSEPDDRKVDASLLHFHIGRATRAR